MGSNNGLTRGIFGLKKIAFIFALILLGLGAVGCGVRGESDKEINIGYFPNVSHAPAMVGIDKELFTNGLENIKMNVKSFPNGSLFMDAMSTGQIDIGYVGPGPVINRYLQGGDVVVLAGASQGENVLVVRKDLEFNSLKDLEGKIVATASTGCTHDLILRKMLQEEGLSVEENGGKVKRIAQQPATMIGLFEQKQIDAAVVSEPWASIMEAQGVVNVVRDSDEVPWEGNLPATILVARKDFVSANPEVIESFIASHKQAIDFINNNKKEAAGIISKQIKEITNEEMDGEIIFKSMERITYSDDLNRKTLQEFANLTEELGFIEGETDLDDLYNIR